MRCSLPLVLSVSMLGCSGSRPADLGLKEDGRLRPCPSSPNCVSSLSDEDEAHRLEPLRGTLDDVRNALQRMERVEIITDNETYLHAEFTSRLMGFVDDVEFSFAAEEGVVHVRSASRLGYSDMGVNRKRVEAIRALLGGGG